MGTESLFYPPGLCWTTLLVKIHFMPVSNTWCTVWANPILRQPWSRDWRENVFGSRFSNKNDWKPSSRTCWTQVSKLRYFRELARIVFACHIPNGNIIGNRSRVFYGNRVPIQNSPGNRVPWRTAYRWTKSYEICSRRPEMIIRWFLNTLQIVVRRAHWNPKIVFNSIYIWKQASVINANSRLHI